MPRRYRPPKRQIEPDIRYNSVMVAQFINKIMKKGKKSLATRIMYDALDIVQERTKRPPLEVMEEAVRNVSPVLEVKPRRVGGSTYQIPVEVPPHRQVSLAMRWLLAAARNRPGKSMAERLAGELIDAARGTGAAVKKKENTHKMAEANRAFAHYRW
ncbi:MAG: 30S ribosomal protein S7 [Chloroflexi bacterium]|nr:MAG: 30S ribosomal protein S7 [Chloroflexota bacterium]RLC92399.1 MAG: 30S ribosomal protein S7 [Chloroflexota bacterium]HEY66933.1 30S ribosomal protein S7 [Thermoflexia bacterium]